jgi:serine/threonine protein kinase
MIETGLDEHLAQHKEYFRDVLKRLKTVMTDQYGVRDASVRPIGSGGARLSIPVKIEGVNAKGEKVRYFGKIIGSTDMMTARAIQLFKNIYLQANDEDSMFEFTKSAMELAKHQYEMGTEIHKLGIPTAKPLGYHELSGGLWLVVAEFLDAKPVTDIKEVKPELLDTVFGYLKKMHDHGIFHGDLKPDNVMIGEKIYIVDVGHFLPSAPSERKEAYDLACQIVSFLEFQSPSAIVGQARKHYSKKELRLSVRYLDLCQQRMDMNVTEEQKEELTRLMEK